MKHAKYTFLFFISLFLRPFFNIDKNLLLFSARGGMGFEGQSKYLFLYTNKNTSYKSVWIAKSRSVVNEVKGNGYQAVYFFTWEALKLALQANAVFITHSLTDVMPIFYKRKTIVIDLWHGIPLKKISFLDENLGLRSRLMDSYKSKRVNYLISNAVYYNEIYKLSFNLDDEQIKHFGLPTIEYLSNNKKFGDQSVNIFSKKNVILYAPTFRDYPFSNPLFTRESLEWLNKLVKKKNSMLYLKLHPAENNPNVKDYDHIKVIDSKYDIYALLPNVNHLVSDYSSVFIDFIAAFPNRKVTLFIPDFEKYKSNRDFNIDFLKVFKTLTVTDNKSVLTQFSDSNQQLAELFNPEKNNSCKQIINLTLNHPRR